MLHIREIQASDWQRYRDVRLHALRDSPDAFGSTYEAEKTRTDAMWSARVDAAIASGRDCALLAINNDDVCGLVWCKLSDTEPGTADLYQMWVDPAARGLGAGHALLGTAVAWARKMAAHRVRLGVTHAESPAMHLYRKHGFRPVGELAPLRDGSPLMAQTLVLELGPGQ